MKQLTDITTSEDTAVNNNNFSPDYLFLTKNTESSYKEISPQQLISVIEKSTGDVIYSMQHPPATPFFSATLITAVISTFCAATAAFTYNRIHWYFVTKRETRVKLAESISEIVTELRNDSISYWLKGYSNKKAKELLDEEMRIKSSLSLINSSIKDYVSKLPKRQRKERQGKLDAYHDELFDLITGDDFESHSRKQDKSKVSVISNRCVAFRVLLNTMKL